ncbi:T9SS type A sorting domain-containing protein [Pseudotamlana agarivorans]|uniref:T9SS type A sorting domain-containing protein n=1 Tax=Pseudotamlana agarivorans TaxID=481183 RepID=UPI000831CAFD|nr:T9SS type A sorting domain-containing protein [Tamlana agarivorans]
MKKIYKNFLLAIIGLATTGLTYAQDSNFAIFTSATTGTLGGVSFTVDMAAENGAENYAYGGFTGEAYSAHEGAWNTPGIRYKPVGSYTCTVTFAQAIPNLKFYVKDWVFSTTVFNHDFVIRSEYDLTAADSKTLVAGVGKGIIEFSGPVTTLTFTRTSGTNDGRHLFTFLDGATLTVDDVYASNDLKLFPSPSSDFVEVSGLKTTENYKIFDVLGAVVGSGTISANQKITITNLVSGIYVLKLETGNAIKFVKK